MFSCVRKLSTLRLLPGDLNACKQGKYCGGTDGQLPSVDDPYLTRLCVLLTCEPVNSELLHASPDHS